MQEHASSWLHEDAILISEDLVKDDVLTLIFSKGMVLFLPGTCLQWEALVTLLAPSQKYHTLPSQWQ